MRRTAEHFPSAKGRTPVLFELDRLQNGGKTLLAPPMERRYFLQFMISCVLGAGRRPHHLVVVFHDSLFCFPFGFPSSFFELWFLEGDTVFFLCWLWFFLRRSFTSQKAYLSLRQLIAMNPPRFITVDLLCLPSFVVVCWLT